MSPMNKGYMKGHMLLSVYYHILNKISNIKNVGFPTMNHILHDSYVERYLTTLSH